MAQQVPLFPRRGREEWDWGSYPTFKACTLCNLEKHWNKRHQIWRLSWNTPRKFLSWQVIGQGSWCFHVNQACCSNPKSCCFERTETLLFSHKLFLKISIETVPGNCLYLFWLMERWCNNGNQQSARLPREHILLSSSSNSSSSTWLARLGNCKWKT